jgi:hypothetical protein
MATECGAVAYGGYPDVLRDFSVRSWRISLGAEYFPATLFGFDAGPVLERLPDAKLRGGLRVRLLLAPLFSSPSFGILPHLGFVETFVGEMSFTMELGALVQFPFPTGLGG